MWAGILAPTLRLPATPPVQGVSSVLLTLADTAGQQGPRGIEIEVTNEEPANANAVTRFSASPSAERMASLRCHREEARRGGDLPGLIACCRKEKQLNREGGSAGCHAVCRPATQRS